MFRRCTNRAFTRRTFTTNGPPMRTRGTLAAGQRTTVRLRGLLPRNHYSWRPQRYPAPPHGRGRILPIRAAFARQVAFCRLRLGWALPTLRRWYAAGLPTPTAHHSCSSCIPNVFAVLVRTSGSYRPGRDCHLPVPLLRRLTFTRDTQDIPRPERRRYRELRGPVLATR